MPNLFNHESQDEAAMEAHQFWALVEINCAPELRFFLCSLYTPICLPSYPEPIKACKSVCTRAKLGCENYMKKFGFEWPEHMNCDLFPEYGSNKEVCMDPMDATQSMTKTTLQINTQMKEMPKPSSPIRKMKKKNSTRLDTKVSCPSPFITKEKNDAGFNKLKTDSIKNCVQPCHSIYFNSLQQEFLFYWLLFWAVLCMLSSVCTTCTYLIDPHRFKYPEKPIIYLSICYLFVSAGYLMRFLLGHENIACDNNGAIKYSIDNLPVSCTVNFILVYYFGMASSIWWIIVALTWFLAAGLKWGAEAITKYSMYFHLVAWLVPFFQTCFILAMSLVDADSATGLCYVGNLSTYNLRMFVILPGVLYLLVGITFLFAGFIALFRIRRLIRRQHVGDSTKTQKLEKLMLRIGVFSILYTVPATCVIACQMYEQIYRDEWERSALCKRISHNNDAQCRDYTDQSPEFSVFVMKYLMMLIIGVTSGFWIWTKKTLTSWNNFLKRVFCCRKTVSGDKNINNRKVKKSSVIYFQANDDLQNNPQNEFYEASSTGCGDENMPLKHNNSASGSSGVGSSCKNAESVMSMQFNTTTNTITTSLPYYQINLGKQLQQGVASEDQNRIKVYAKKQQLQDIYSEFDGRNDRQREIFFTNYAQIR